MTERAVTATRPAADLPALARAIGAARPVLSGDDQRRALAIYGALAEGHPVAAPDLAERVAMDEKGVAWALMRWPGVFRDERDSVVGFWGLSLAETAHRFVVDGRRLYTWCAWDALFLPELLGCSAEVESRCPTSGETVRLTVSPTSVETVSPAEAVVSMLVPGRSFAADPVASFCHYIHLFGTPQAAERWTTQHPGTFVLSVDQAFELGRLCNRINFPLAFDDGSNP